MNTITLEEYEDDIGFNSMYPRISNMNGRFAKRITEACHRYVIPSHMCGAILRYVLVGIEPGGFLGAVICNDLVGAVARADDENIRLLPEYVRVFYNHAPGNCWGSRERLDQWARDGGMGGWE